MKIRATITWLTLYDKNRACGHPTDIANLRWLAASGWELNGRVVGTDTVGTPSYQELQ